MSIIHGDGDYADEESNDGVDDDNDDGYHDDDGVTGGGGGENDGAGVGSTQRELPGVCCRLPWRPERIRQRGGEAVAHAWILHLARSVTTTFCHALYLHGQ